MKIERVNTDPISELKQLFKLKESVAVNRDGITVGTTLVTTYKGRTYKAVALKFGYGLAGKEYQTLTELTRAVTGVDTDPTSMWYIEDKSLKSYIEELLDDNQS